MSTSPHDNTDVPIDGHAPPSKRPRLISKACEACRLRKAKCDSARPQCDTCCKKGLDCVYREKNQPGIKPGHGKAMEARLAILEDNMERMNQTVQEVLSHVQRGEKHERNILRNQDLTSSSYHLQRQEQNNQPPADWEATSEIPDLLPLENGSALAPIDVPFEGTGQGITKNELPPDEILQELIKIFFQMVDPWFPLFHQPTFIRKMHHPERQILLHGIIVIAFRFWPNEYPPIEARDNYVRTSRDQLLLKTIDTCTLISTQALALLALDALGQGTGPQTWNIMSMLVCAGRHLSLSDRSFPGSHSTNTRLVRNEDSDDENNLSNIDTEHRRRLFWLIYMLDRLSSVSHGQYGGVQTKNVRVLHPSSEGNWSPPNSSERFQYVPPIKLTHANCPNRLWHYHIDLLAFMDRSNQLLIQPVNLSIPANCQEWKNTFRKLDMMLSTWHKNLPLEDKEPQTKFDPMWVMVFATYYIIKLRLYTVAAFPSTTSPYLKSSTAARSSCRQIIGDLASLATSVPSHALDQLGPMFAFALWIASRSLLILWTTGYEKSYGPMPADLGILLSSLQRLALRWPCAQRYSDLIQLILDTKDTANGPSILDIFNDTKRTAHGLQERLAPISLNMFTDLNLTSFDFLEGSGFDTGDPFTPLNMVPLGIELGDDWL